MSARRLVLWRHGRTAWNSISRFQGQEDVPLDEVGRDQVRRAAQTLIGLKLRGINSGVVASVIEAEYATQSESDVLFVTYLTSGDSNNENTIDIVSEKTKSKNRKTWVFEAENVRDFAWTSSRKYVWDAMPQIIAENNNKVMAMSFYPKESYGIYRKYSTKAVAHTIKT